MTVGAVAAVDLGATSGRVIVGQVGPDTLDTTTVARFPNSPVRMPDGLHWNLSGMYGAVLDGLREALRTEESIHSIGVDSWAVDYGLLRDGRLLGEPFHYRDSRTARGVAAVHSRVPRVRLFERNGLQFLPFNTVYQLASEPREVLEFADSLLLIPDLIGYWLSGVTRTEYTNASTTGLFNVQTRRWDDDLIDRLGLRRTMLAPIINPGDTLGHLRKETCTLIGARQGVAVTSVGSHDTASAVVAVPMRAESAAYISCGTWGLVGVETEAPILSDDARQAGFTNEGGVDDRVRVLRNVMGLWVLSETIRQWERELGRAIDLTTLLREASDVPRLRTVVFDINEPRFLPPGDMTSRIDAWCDEHATATPSSHAEYAKSIIESLAHAFSAAVAEAGRVSGIDIRSIHIVGGGALNELLCQRVADVAGLPVIAGPVEATALGNILIQARSLGLIRGSLESLRDLVARTHAPRRHNPTS